MERTIGAINQRIERGDAIILTAQELEGLMEDGREGELREVDVVTTGTMGLMSGTFAILSFPVTSPGTHRRFVRGWMEGVPVSAGPCPNEGLGLLDCMVFGTSRGRDDGSYGGGHLFRDLVEGREVDVEVVTDEGATVCTTVTLADMPIARMMSSRNLFRNYRAFVNPSPTEVRSIFHALPLPPAYGGLTFSGCGHLNPLQNDPQLRWIGIGTRLLFNGGEGFVIGEGTRSSVTHPNLMTVADMKGMDPSLMGGFQTAEGPECIASYGVPIPILDDASLASVMVMDDRVPLDVVDVRDRRKLAEIDYGKVWHHDETVSVNGRACIACPRCEAEAACPRGAITRREDGPALDRAACFNCGTCVAACPQGCFLSDLGRVRLSIDGTTRDIPIIGRGSDRMGAIRTMEDLKERLLDRRFPLMPKVADIRH